MKLCNKSLQVYQMLVQHIARDNSGLSLARRKDATCFLRWIMSVITDSTLQMCHQKAMGSKTMERRFSTVILNVYQSTGIKKEDGSRHSLESHGKLDEIRRFYNKKFEEGHDVHRNLARAEDYSKPTKWGEHQYVSGVMGTAYNSFFDSEAGNTYMNFEVAGLEVAEAFLVSTSPRKKHQKEYRQFLAEIGQESFKRPLLTHRNAITTG